MLMRGAGRRRVVSWTSLALLAVFFVAFAVDDQRPVRKDARQNLTMAFNLAEHGVGSTAEPAAGERPEADARREPLYPALLSLALVGSDATLDCLVETRGECQGETIRLRLVGVALHLAMSVTVFALARRFLPWGWSLATAVAAALAPMLSTFASTYLTEAAASFLLVGATYCLVRQVETGARRWALAGGVALGLLALTKGIVVFAGVTALGLSMWLLRRHSLRRAAALVAVGAVAFALVLAPWSVRNAREAGTVLPSSGDGPVLSVRAESLDMSGTEYLTSFVVNTGVVGPAASRAIFDEEDYRRHLPQEAGSFYQLGVAGADARTARAAILDRPGKHLALTLPFAWRGAFGANPLGTYAPESWPAPVRAAVRGWALLGVPLRWLGFTALFLLAVRGVRDVKVGALVLPALALFAWYAATSHFIPRYSAPVLPITCVALAVVLRGLFAGRAAAAGPR